MKCIAWRLDQSNVGHRIEDRMSTIRARLEVRKEKQV